MKYKAIPVDGYYLIVSNEECSNFESKIIIDGNYYPINVVAQSKVINPQIPLFDAPWEEDVEKLAEKSLQEDGDCVEQTYPQVYTSGYITGYNAAKAKHEKPKVYEITELEFINDNKINILKWKEI